MCRSMMGTIGDEMHWNIGAYWNVLGTYWNVLERIGNVLETYWKRITLIGINPPLINPPPALNEIFAGFCIPGNPGITPPTCAKGEL